MNFKFLGFCPTAEGKASKVPLSLYIGIDSKKTIKGPELPKPSLRDFGIWTFKNREHDLFELAFELFLIQNGLEQGSDLLRIKTVSPAAKGA